VTVKDDGGLPLSGGVAGVWDPSRSHLRIVLRDIVTEARVGLHPWEQHPERLTRLVVNVEMFALLFPGGLKAEEQTGIVDYDHIRAALKEWPLRPHILLLETPAKRGGQLMLPEPPR
jgi:7,8-dihydroneopterin aldolase/epimerase/oxygenase